MPKTPSQLVINYFDATWYLKAYLDVANASIAPEKHFVMFGWKEGRWPCDFNAVRADQDLWDDAKSGSALSQLKSLFEGDCRAEKSLAAWFLGRWYASFNEWQEAHYYSRHFADDDFILELIPHDGPVTLLAMSYLKVGELEKVKSIISASAWKSLNERAIVSSVVASGREKIAILNNIYTENNLLQLEEKSVGLDGLNCTPGTNHKSSWLKPLVTIIIPCFNAEIAIQTALKSLLAQTYKKIEIIVVNDASTDNTEKAIKEIASTDKRVRYIKLEKNGGAYNARNVGLKAARGKFITTHDSDDWSHPQKIEIQVNAIKANKNAKASVSSWVRTDTNLVFQRWRIDDGLIHRNVSSLMFKRNVLRKLGYWDAVSINADTEFYYRILAKYGQSSIVEAYPGIPLAFGRVESSSLTNSGPTHIRTQFSGIRKEYLDKALNWHKSAKSLYMPLRGKRKFVAPPFICRGTEISNKDNLKNYITDTEAFDECWYLAKYKDIASANIEPIDHYVKYGIHEGREPNAIFSPSAYAWVNSVPLPEAFTLWLSDRSNFSNILYLDGKPKKHTAKSVMMFAHLAGPELFGAEKSFLDCVQMLAENDVNIYVVLPSALNEEYVKEVLKYATKVFFLPICWWDGKREVINTQVAVIEKLITFQNIDIVYVNTITVWEPLVACRNLGVQSIMHIRELPENDNSLCEALTASPEMIRKHVAKAADLYIANSKFTQSYYDLGEVCEVVPNAVSINNALNTANKESSPLVVAMMSSNIEKKGIRDFFEIAFECSKRNLPVLFEVHGPRTDILTSLLNNYSEDNVVFKGYSIDTANALKTVNVILNLSNFDESFGRTVIEGMASGCVPIAYNKGALTEVVSEDCGFLVPFKMTSEVVNLIDKLSQNREEFEKLSKQAFKAVENSYSKQKVKVKLSDAILAR
mgnify:FL=1|tara:strand:+ start:5285 stop:8056 length:2772 start_codon:yes stop_codon:yes gene_type:complete